MLFAVGTAVNAALGVGKLSGLFETDKEVYFPGDTVQVSHPQPQHHLHRYSVTSTVTLTATDRRC